jgi:hypothetical protein
VEPVPRGDELPAVDGRLRRAVLSSEGLRELAPGPTADTTPALAVEVRVIGAHVQVVQWLMGEPFWIVAVTGQA